MNRTRKYKRTVKKGGRKIGQGVFGIVYSPVLKCEDGKNDSYKGSGFVGKILNEMAGNLEYKSSEIVRRLDPEGDWSITSEHVCDLSKDQVDTDYLMAIPKNKKKQLIYKNGGQTLESLILTREIKDFEIETLLSEPGSQALNPDGMSTLIKACKMIIPGLNKLNKTHLHNDLHLGNIVWDGHKPRLIDFGALKSVDGNISRYRKAWFQSLGQLGFIDGEDLKNDDPKKATYDFMRVKFDKAIYDDATKSDLVQIYKGLRKILESRWIDSVYPGKYTEWLRSDPYTRSDYALAILSIPE